MSKNIEGYNSKRTAKAQETDAIVLGFITKKKSTTAPKIIKSTGMTEYAVYRSIKRLTINGQVVTNKSSVGKNGRQIGVLMATGRKPSSFAHEKVMTMARTLKQPFASMVAQMTA